jgi:hypothetical protein
VVGDLHERYRSPLRYAADTLSTVPLVIFSRVRRTSDPRVVLTQFLALYLSFLQAAWMADGTLLRDSYGLLRLAAPTLVALLGLALHDAYSNLKPPSADGTVRGPLVGMGLALGSQAILWAEYSGLAVPRVTLAFGCVMGLLFSTGVRMLFPPVSSHPQGAGAPAFWLRLDGAPVVIPAALMRWLKGIASILAILLFVLIAFQLLQRGAG